MSQIKSDDAYRLMETVYEILFVVDKDDTVLHASRIFLSECGKSKDSIVGSKIDSFLTPESYKHCKKLMQSAKDGRHSSALVAVDGSKEFKIPLKIRYSQFDNGEYIFFGTILNELSKIDDWEKDERIKELACFYLISEWIDISPSVKTFFTDLPDYLSKGMRYSDQTVVYSIYQDIEYGSKVETSNYIKVDLAVSRQKRGEIRIGYLDENLTFLPEKQKLLDEIGRMLNLALERKEFRDSLAHVKEEEEEYARKIDKLKEEVQKREIELENLSQNLHTVNSYLDRVSKDWEESKVRLETMFKAIPDRVAIIDLKRNVVNTNRDDEVIGNKCHKTFFNSPNPCKDCRLVRIIREKTPVMVEIKHGDKIFEVHAIPIFNNEHEVEGIIEFYKDISLEKLYEHQLLQADKLAALGQLVSGIGHEINNPNQFIKGNIKIIQQAFEDILPILDNYSKSNPDLKIARLQYDFFRENILTLVNDMANGSNRIKRIVEGLRRFARPDEGELIDNVDINQIIHESARLVHNQIHKYADIVLDLEPDIPIFVGNSQKLEQVIINLMINAAQAMPDDRKGIIKVSTHKDCDSLIIQVQDNGMGMSESTKKHLFDPFFTTKRAKGGTGLGLSIAYRIIEEHKGNISVSSKQGDGTTFTINIPIVEPKVTEITP